MSAHKFLKFFFNNLWITVIILLICVGFSIYYLTLPDNTELKLFGYELPFEKNKSIPIIFLICGFFTNIFINLLTGLLQKDKSSDTNGNIPNIEIKNFVNTQSEITSSTETNAEKGKFYPTDFFPDLKYFEGRVKLLKELKEKLAKQHRASIHDISGIGKTFSTYKFAFDFQANYKKIFFVRANKEEMLKSLAEIGIWLNPSLKDEPDQTKLAETFKAWLEKNDKWLVIYDNVDIPQELFPFVPANLKGDCIFTSNFPLTDNLAVNVNIETLNEAESKRLLFSRATNTPHQTPRFSDEREKIAFEKIVDEIDGHPLALNTTGAFISKNRFNFQMFVNKLENEPNVLLESDDEFDKYHKKSVLKAFSIAIEDVSERKSEDKFKNSSILTRKILASVSFIAPGDIPEELLREIFETHLKPKTFFQKLWVRLFGEKLLTQDRGNLWEETRLKLLNYDLLKLDKSLTRLTTHRLIQKVVESKLLNTEKKDLLQTTTTALNSLFDFPEYETKENCELYTPHAIILVEKAEKIGFSTEEIASINFKIGRYLHETVKYQDSIAYFQKAIDFCKTLPAKEQVSLAMCFNALALVFDSQGKYDKAIEKYEEILRIDEKTVGKEHPSYATHLNNLAEVYRIQGRYDEAIEKFEEALRIDEKTIGKEHPNYAVELNNLALVYLSQGRYDEAIEKFEEALQIDEKTVGKEHPNYAIRLGNLAKIYISQGNFQLAEKNNAQALEIFEKSVGKLHPYYATCLNDLARVYDEQGRYDEAIEKFEEALRIGEKTIGKEHPNYAARLHNLAMVYKSQGRYNEALPMHVEAMRISVKFLGENHPTTQNAKRNLEDCRRLAGKK